MRRLCGLRCPHLSAADTRSVLPSLIWRLTQQPQQPSIHDATTTYIRPTSATATARESSMRCRPAPPSAVVSSLCFRGLCRCCATVEIPSRVALVSGITIGSTMGPTMRLNIGSNIGFINNRVYNVVSNLGSIRTVTAGAIHLLERLRPPTLRGSHLLQPRAAESPYDEEAAEAPAGIRDASSQPNSTSSSSSSSSSSGTGTIGAVEFAEVYSPRRSQRGPSESRGSVGAPVEPHFSSAVGTLSQGGAPTGHTTSSAAQGKRSAAAAAENSARPARHQATELPPLLSATDAAVARIRELVKSYNEKLQQEAREGQPRACGIRISLQKQGCSGMAYNVSICTERARRSNEGDDEGRGALAHAGKAEKGTWRIRKSWSEDEVVGVGGVEIRVAADAVMLLVGTQVDFVDEEVQTGFVFNNPNQKQSCGCGKSFMV